VPSRIIVLVTVPVSLALIRVALVGIVVPLMLVAVATPKTGVTRVGVVDNTVAPVPVEVVTPVPPLATPRVPVTPVDRGSPVALVRTPDAGVPRAGVVSTGLVKVLLVKV
jgi:hypothetical protein